MAGGADRGRDGVCGCGKQVPARNAGEGDVQRVGQALLGVAVEHQAGHGVGEAPLQVVAQGGEVPRGLRQRFARQPRRLAKADYLRHVLGAGPQAVLLVGAEQNRFDGSAVSHVERTDALGSIELVAGERQQVDAERIDVERDLAGRLGRVGMHQAAVGARQPGDLGDRLEGADLVVGVHHRDQCRVRAQRRRDVGRRDAARRIDADDRDVPTEFAQMQRRLHHGRMLDGTDYDVSFVRQRAGDAEQGQVVGLGRAAGEDDFPVDRIDQRRDLGSRRGHRPPRPQAEGMGRGRIAEVFLDPGAHRGRDLGRDRRGRVVVEVDGEVHPKAWLRSAIRSSASSRPIDSRSMASEMPRRARSSGVRP